MDFLSKFKGKTSFVSKEGIESVLMESNSPVLKRSNTFDFDASPHHRKTKTIASSHQNLEQLMHEMRMDDSPMLSTTSNSPTLKRPLKVTQKPNTMTDLQLKFQNDSYFFEKEEATIALKKSGYHSPQHNIREADQMFNSGVMSFSQRINLIKPDPRGELISDPRQQQQQYAPVVMLEKQRTLDPSVLRRFSSERQLKPKNKLVSIFQDETDPELQESRLARMNFVERQEKVLNKYKPRIAVQTGSRLVANTNSYSEMKNLKH